MQFIKFTKPDGRTQTVTNQMKATKYIREACTTCERYQDCNGNDAVFCNHMTELMQSNFSSQPKTLSQSKILHSMGVANFLYTYATSHYYDRKTAQDLYLVGLLHDIGYLDNHTGIQHGEKGATILERNGYDKHYCDIIAHHGALTDVISEHQQLLWLADLCIDHQGNFIGYESRYNSICQRYSKTDYRRQNVASIIQELRQQFPQYK